MTEKKPYMLRFPKDSKLIELGGGANPLFHPNVDVLPNPMVDIVHDLGTFPWPLESDAYDGVFAQYVIEHVPWKDTRKFIAELFRIVRKNGSVVVVTSNTVEQCKVVAEKGASDSTSELLFGSQEFPNHGGVHKVCLSPEHLKKLFEESGFTVVKTYPHPVSDTDFILEAYKIPKDEIFERQYFEDGITGYKDYNNWSFNYSTAQKVLVEKPESVLEVGAGRGYISRIIQNNGVKATAMDISNHCYQTRAIDDFYVWDVTEIPWMKVNKKNETYVPFSDKEYDLCFSINFLEHIPEEKIDAVIKEMARVTKRGYHGIHMTDSPYYEHDPDYDSTHVSLHEKAWWISRFKSVAPDYPIFIDHERTIQYEKPEVTPPSSHAPGMFKKDGEILAEDELRKVNIGCYKDMFYFGWLNIDILDMKPYSDQFGFLFVQHDVTKPLLIKDDFIDIVFSSHLLEHLTREEGFAFLKECHRILKPGGIIRLSVPDTKKITDDYVKGNIKEHRYVNTGVSDADDDVLAYYNLLLAGHKTLYDEESAKQVLQKIGFKNIKTATPFTSRSETIVKQTITPHPMLSVVIEAEK